MNNRTMKRYAPIFLLPTMIAFAIGFIAPFILGVYLSFCEFTTVTDAKFVGFKNYIRFWNDPSDVFLHFPGIYRIVYDRDSGTDQRDWLCGSSGTDEENQRNKPVPYRIFYAEPDWRSGAWIRMAAAA